jgi:hypothetical protein
MSQLLIQKYLNDLADLRRVSGSQRESVVREAFKTLLKDWGRSRGLLFVPEHVRICLQRDGTLSEPGCAPEIQAIATHMPTLLRRFHNS